MEVNIEKIMAEIRDNISENKYGEQDLKIVGKKQICPKGFSKPDFDNTVNRMNNSSRIPEDMPILGKAKGIKKVISKTINFAIKPRAEVQNNMNNAVVTGFIQIQKYMDEQEKTIRELNEKIEALEKELKEIQK